MQVRLLETRVGLRNSTTRIPFRYGKSCLTKCPQLILAAKIEANGRTATGYGGDCLPPGWFDKSPDKSFARQIEEMLATIACAERVFSERFAKETDFFGGWMDSQQAVHSITSEQDLPGLLASFGVSLVERAMIDAICRHGQIGFAQAARTNLFGIRAGEVHASIARYQPKDWLPASPQNEIFVRHTVGLADPLTAADVSAEDRLDDNYPQTLEEYVSQTGIRYLKVKVSNALDTDVHRLRAIASIIQKHRGSDYIVTLDGNEQYSSIAEFDELVASILCDPVLSDLWENVLLIEQPLERRVALSSEFADGIRELSRRKPVIIDESDERLDSFATAAEVGYHGVSSKNCKGPLKSLMNTGLIWDMNGNRRRGEYLMSGEDLCAVGVVPVQSDLCLVATIGLNHVERNGHHYHPGLSYLPSEQQRSALAAHEDFYCQTGHVVRPNLVDGRFSIGSLHCVGFGFDVEPDFGQMQSPDEWEFDSLGL